MKNIEVNVTSKDNEIVIREGIAKEIENLKPVTITGQIDTVFRFLEKRNGEFKTKKAHILVDKDKMSISIKCDEGFDTGLYLLGKIEFDKAFLSFGINTGQQITTFELADFIKMNRSYFKNQSEAANITTALKNFKAKVNKDLENSDNNRGDRSVLMRQVVESNIPESFKLVLPIFKGCEPKTIDVEIYIDADDFACSLISPQAREIQQTELDGIIDEQVNKISDLYGEIVIINI